MSEESKKYRIFYDSNYQGDYLDLTEDIVAKDDEDAIKKAGEFIKAKNDERKEASRKDLIERGVTNAENFSDKQLLTGDCYILRSVYRLKLETVQVLAVKERLTLISTDK